MRQGQAEIYMRPPWWQVFISSQMSGGPLAAERKAAIETAEEFPVVKAWAWERDSVAGPYYSKEECIGQAGASEVLILILDDAITPVMRAEYRAAHEAGAALLVLLKANVRRDASLENFVRRARRHAAVTKNFADIGELRTHIEIGLREWTLRVGRSWMLETRERRQTKPVSGDYGSAMLEWEGEDLPLSDFVERLRDRAEEGRTTEALEGFSEIAHLALEAGVPPVARDLLNELEDVVPSAAVDQEWRGWLLNLKGRIESAHRRPDQARDAFERMRQIGRSIGSPDMEGTALQNLGVEAVIAGQHDRAMEHLAASLPLKYQAGDSRGGIQVLFNLVNVLEGRGQEEAAAELLDDLERLLEGVRDPHLRCTLHGQRGMVACKRGDFVAGKASFKRALAAARRSGSAQRQITCLQNLGATASDAGNRREAVRWYRKSVALASETGDTHQEEIQRRSLAVSLLRTDQPDEAALQFSAAAEIARQLGDRRAHAVALGDAAASFHEAGHNERALALSQDALEAVDQPGEDEWRANQLSNSALILESLGRHEDGVQRLTEAANLTSDPTRRITFLRRGAEMALMHAETADQAPGLLERELVERKRVEPGASWAWEAAQMGALLKLRVHAQRARGFFSQALRVFARTDPRRSFFIRNDRAIAAAQCGDLRSAVDDLRTCLRIGEDLDDRALRQQAHMNLGEIERRRGRDDAALTHLEQALSLAEQLEDLEARADTLLLLSLLRSDSNRLDEAETLAQEALRTGADLHSARLMAEAQGRLGTIAYRRQSFAEAARFLRRAVRLRGDELTVHLAEDLGGLVLSQAARGKPDEDSVQRLVNTSDAVGWDDSAAEELEVSAVLLAENNRRTEALELYAVALAVGLRGRRPGAEGMSDDLIGGMVVRLALWLRGISDSSEARTAILKALDECIGEAGRAAIAELLDLADVLMDQRHQKS